MANIDVQTREGFDRLYTKHREYDEMHANKGCTVLQILEEKEKTNHAKMLNDIKHLTDEVQNIVETQERGVAPETLKNLLTYIKSNIYYFWSNDGEQAIMINL